MFWKYGILPKRAVVKSLLERGIQRGQVRQDVDLEAAIDCIMVSILVRHLNYLPMDRQWVQSVIRIVLDGAREAVGE